MTMQKFAVITETELFNKRAKSRFEDKSYLMPNELRVIQN